MTVRPAIGLILAIALLLGGCASAPPVAGSDPRSRFLGASCPPGYPVGAAYDALRSSVDDASLRRYYTAARTALVLAARRLHAAEWPASIGPDIQVVEAEDLAQAAWFDRAVRSPSIGPDWWPDSPSVEASVNRIRDVLHIDSTTACE